MDLVFWADRTLLIEILKSDIRFEVDKELRKNNITIPYPQTDVHLKNDIQTKEQKDKLPLG
jgi:small-conductance mechanosensitive channel